MCFAEKSHKGECGPLLRPPVRAKIQRAKVNAALVCGFWRGSSVKSIKLPVFLHNANFVEVMCDCVIIQYRFLCVLINVRCSFFFSLARVNWQMASFVVHLRLKRAQSKLNGRCTATSAKNVFDRNWIIRESTQSDCIGSYGTSWLSVCMSAHHRLVFANEIVVVYN